jgi:SAM-dependent methyltransferase
MTPIRLNLGSASVKLPGYISVDLYDDRADLQMDILDLDFEDNSVDEILASHVFEHLSPHYAMPALKEWFRVLKSGGKLIMEMPDFEVTCKRFLEQTDYYKKLDYMNVIFAPSDIRNGKPIEGANHLWGWWPDSLYNHLNWAGFTDMQLMEQQLIHPYDNFRMEAYKPL